MDEQNTTASTTNPPPQQPFPGRRRDHSGVMGGVVMIVIGVLFLMHNFIPGFNIGDYWPVLLIAIGGMLLWRSRSEIPREGRRP